jgi:hypothetical protein
MSGPNEVGAPGGTAARTDNSKWLPLPKQYELADSSGTTTVRHGENTFDIEPK